MSDRKDPWVTIHILSEEKPRIFSPERRISNPAKFQETLKLLKDTKSIATCGCDPSQKLRLYVHTAHTSGVLSLRRFPHTGPAHAVVCNYYCRVNKDGGVGTYTSDAVREDSGTLRISMNYSLRVSPDKTEQPQPEDVLPPSRASVSKKLPRLSLLGLLHLLWENTATHTWFSGFKDRRSLNGVMGRIYNEAKTICQGRTTLSDVLLLQERAACNLATIRYAAGSHRRLMVISELARWQDKYEKGTGSLPVANPVKNSMPYLNIDPVRWRDTLARFWREVAWWKQGGKVIVIAVTDVPVCGTSSNAQVRQVCMMMVSQRFIPLDSSFEGMIEEKLVREDRSFIKPLRYDSALNEFHPDFCLTDTGENSCIPMEVWGMKTETYELHREEKTRWYNERYSRNWWSWDASVDKDGANIPVFPEKCSKE